MQAPSLGAEPTTDEERRERFPYRMKDLCELTGMPRQAIHFYIQQGLLPPGHKTGRNMAWYGPEHVERLELVRKLQHERFLPLKAIKAMLDGREDRFSPRQQAFLADVKRELAASLAPEPDQRRPLVDATELVRDNGVEHDELERMAEIGILTATVDADGTVRVPEDDLWVLESFGKMRAAGFTRDLGFEVDDLAFYVEAIDSIFERDARLLSDRLADQPPIVAARMIERALPILHDFLVRFHARRVRDFFSSM